MRVLATAGHVDHGKSTLVRALTGMEPDRLAEERRRGLTVDLGFVWTRIGEHVLAFVDVPGHERFVPNMLAGAGPVAAAVFVVAADEGWQAQSAEHLAALDAFGVRHGLLVVTKADRADPEPVLRDARDRLAATTLGDVPGVAVSAHTGAGLDRLRGELTTLADRLPPPDPAADVRLWVDRVFTVRGAGTVVTGTLGAGTLRAGDELELSATARRVGVRGLQSLGEPCEEVGAVARVAVNLRGTGRDDVRRGDALLTPGAWRATVEVDVRLRGDKADDLHRELVLHVGAASVPCRIRPLGTDLARLSLREAVPLRAGDTGLLRDPGEHRVPAGIEVLDPNPPGLRRRGAARERALELDGGDPAAAYLRRHAAVPVTELRALGWSGVGSRVGEWAVDPGLLAALPGRAAERFAAWAERNPLAAGMPAEALRRALGVPADLLGTVLAGSGLELHDGLVRRPGAVAVLPAAVDRAVTELERRFADEPFRAPEAAELAALRLGPRELAAAERAGRLLRIADGVVLPADAAERARAVLGALAQPFTVSAARRALGTTRRVAVPLLEYLDGQGHTERAPDSTRRLR
ncbi:selenocysteine-specific translation elongation factor [Prauserella muralis]|uniref:Selenocysteine-specific elongation factor n=1 Tax=Prauserella muralis TaxID=588067 RepID=A0A2V4AIM7_9PSEU|nr:selenocysteine-specific translation elongation factor [Prauserella muralis]PXY19036.1 selenocysteine-specific translation elongation factor [Prauserella muralis]TWE28930.1 selenocysteine-specific translation elongation factor SelB [Prauserella muralis]